VGLFLLLTGGLASACSSSPSAPVPPPSSSPEQVARIYPRAAKAEDRDLTAAPTLPRTWNWCDDPQLLDYRDYRSAPSAYFLPASQAGRDQECVRFEINTYGSSDGSMPVGWQPCSLRLVRTSAGWRLRDQGQP
jgi:hypothetical protein